MKVKDTDLVQGVLALHTVTEVRPVTGRIVCKCGKVAADEAMYREHVAQRIVKTLRSPELRSKEA